MFLQEVVGFHARFARRHLNWPVAPQYEFLADSVWEDFAYGRNAVVDDAHHGNAILSKFPIQRWDNEDVSMHRFERRGLLHCEIQVRGWTEKLHAINVHLGLLRIWREKQLEALASRIERLVPHDAPLIIAGDFNDWTRRASEYLMRALDVSEVFETYGRGPARSFPAVAAGAAPGPDLRARLQSEAGPCPSWSELGALLRPCGVVGTAHARSRQHPTAGAPEDATSSHPSLAPIACAAHGARSQELDARALSTEPGPVLSPVIDRRRPGH